MTSFEATKEITFKLNNIHNLSVTQLTNAQAFGSVDDDNPVSELAFPIDHGINLYFEATTTTGHAVEQDFNIADSIP